MNQRSDLYYCYRLFCAVLRAQYKRVAFKKCYFIQTILHTTKLLKFKSCSVTNPVALTADNYQRLANISFLFVTQNVSYDTYL